MRFWKKAKPVCEHELIVGKIEIVPDWIIGEIFHCTKCNSQYPRMIFRGPFLWCVNPTEWGKHKKECIQKDTCFT